MEPEQKDDGRGVRTNQPSEYAPAPLPPIYVLVQYGLWTYPDDGRDKATDVTDEEVTKWL